MDANQDNYFVLDLMNFVFQIAGKPLPCNLQRKLDKYSTKEESIVSLNIKKTAMIYINDHLISGEDKVGIASKMFESKMKDHFRSPGDFLKFLSHFIFVSLLEYLNFKQDSPDIFFDSVGHFLERMRKKGRFDVDFWKKLDHAATLTIENDREKNSYRPLRKTSEDLDMSSEKGFVLKIMNYIFDFYCRDLPTWLQMELDEYRMISRNDPNIKNAVFVILNEVGKKVKLLGGIEPVFLYYFNLSSMNFTEKYFLEFCVCCTKKALLEYYNQSKDQSPIKAYELLVHMIRLAKEDGKFSSLEYMNDAASLILEDDHDRIEHERLRNDASVDDTSESAQQGTDSDNLIVSSQQTVKDDCKCCTLN